MLFSQQSAFYVSLTNSLIVGNKPVIMKHCDIVVLTGEYPVEKLTVSDSSTSYVLIKFSVNKSFREFLKTQKNSEKIEKEFLLENKIWCHAKNLKAFENLIDIKAHCFWHQEDDLLVLVIYPLFFQ